MFEKMLKDEMKCIEICKEAEKIYNRIRKIEVYYEASYFRSAVQREDLLDAPFLVSISHSIYVHLTLGTI